MNMIRKKKADFIFLYIKKIFVLMLVLIMGLTSVSQNIHAQAQENPLGIESYVNYSDDLQNGTIYLDLQNVDNDNYEIREILDPQMNQLSMEALEYAVTVNGDYIFTVKYIERNQEELKDEKEDDNSIDSALLIDDLHIEEKIKTYELVVTVDGIIDSNTDVEDMIESNTDVDDMTESNTDVEDMIESNTDVDDMIQSDTDHEVSTIDTVSFDDATRVIAAVNLSKVFDVTTLNVNGIPMADSTNVNGAVEEDKIILYNATQQSDIPTSYYAANTWWQTSTRVDAKNRLSMRSDWEFKYTFKGAQLDANKGSRGSIYLNFGNESASVSHDIEISAMANGKDKESSIFIWDSKSHTTNKEIIAAHSNWFTVQKEVVVTCDYDDVDTATISISCGGKKSTKSFKLSEFGDSVSMAMGGDVTWGAGENNATGQADYPRGTANVTFQSLSYTNLNPKIESLQWFDSSNTELDINSTVSPGDVLSVKATVINDSTKADVLPAKLFFSDDPSLAMTRGISGSDLTNGVAVALTNQSKVIDFKVVVLDTIGDISLGVKLEDDFFHSKSYSEIQTKISTGDIFAEDYPKYTVSNPKRNKFGKAVYDLNNEIVFEADKNQTQLNQDSYVKVDISLKNPRQNEAMDINMSTVTTTAASAAVTAPGLDLTTIHGLVTSGNVSSSITKDNLVKFLNGSGNLTFTLGADDLANISFYVPVKQSLGGKPFDTGAQKIEYKIEGTIVVGGNSSNGTWTNETTVMDSVTDIDVDLAKTEIPLQRDHEFDLSAASLFSPVTNGLDVSVDFENVGIMNQGQLADWKYFGLDSVSDYTGKVALFAENNKTLGVMVTYNGILTLSHENSSYKHYTRLGNEVDIQRTSTKNVTLKVDGGTVVTPDAFLEIPKSVYLNDEGGIDDAHAGIKAEVKLISDIMPGYTFNVEADNNFIIENSDASKTFTVSLYDKDKNPYVVQGSTANRVDLGTIKDDSRSKTVWFNLVKDPSLAPGENFTGTMQFYITME